MSNRPSSTKAGHRRSGSSSARVAQARGAGSGRATWWIVIGAAVVVVLALIVAIAVTRRAEEVTAQSGVASAGFDTSAGAPPDLVTGTVTTNGAALPEAPSGTPGEIDRADPALGQAAPTLTGQRFDGQAITIGGTGRPMVVMFLAHWCPHCQKEVPVITEHLGGRLPADVDLFGVSTGVSQDRPNFPPGAWLRRENWPVPTLVDDGNGTAAQAYGLSSYPFFTAIDRSGKVVARTSGELTPAQIDSLVAAARG